MVASPSFADFLHEQLSPLGQISTRRMFGKSGVFCDSVMIAMVADDTLYFRVDAHNRDDLKDGAAYPPLSYAKAGSKIDLAFWRAPNRVFDDPEELQVWARSALSAARRVAAMRQRPTAARKTRTAQRDKKA